MENMTDKSRYLLTDEQQISFLCTDEQQIRLLDIKREKCAIKSAFQLTAQKHDRSN